MDEAEFGVNDISKEEYKRLKEKTMAKKKSMKKKKTKKEKEKKETRLASAPRMTKLADDFLAELKQREFKRRSKHPT